FSCAMDGQGQVWCWGLNAQGQVGVNSEQGMFLSPQLVGGTYSDIKGGDDIVCGLRVNKTVFCWGALGNRRASATINGIKYSYFAFRRAPEPLGDIKCSASCNTVPTEEIQSFAVGGDHACVLSGGKVWCFGSNQFAQFGNGKSNPTSQYDLSSIPISGAVALSAGAFTTAVTVSTADPASSKVLAWGRDETSFSSNGLTLNPKDLPPIPSKATLHLGERLTATVSLGQLVLAGRNDTGQLANNSTSPGTYGLNSPSLVDVADVSYWKETVCAWQSGNSLWCWGANTSGAAGTGDLKSPLLVPTPVKW
ncbi:MAG: hypothetical protein EOO70_07425, partial [Myxococcaceae bacterium]